MARRHPKHWNDFIVVHPMGFEVMVVRPSSLAMFLEHMDYHGCGPHFKADMQVHLHKVENGGGCFYFDGENYILLLPDEWSDTVIYHEALHCAIRLWHDVGAGLLLPDNEEVLTYTQGYIVELLKQKFYKVKKNAGTEG